MQKILLYLRALWGMARPFIMLSVILVYAAGAIVAWATTKTLDWGVFWYGFIVLLLASMSIHYVNEYADYETDAITAATAYSGGSGVLPGGDVPRGLALWAAWVTLGAGVMLAVVGILTGIFPAVALPLLLLGAFGGWMYSLPPLKLIWNGWGEVDNALLGGMLLPLYGYTVTTGSADLWVALAFLPFALVDFLNLLATTWPDRHADVQVGKRTLATRWPVQRLRLVYIGVATVAMLLLATQVGGTLPVDVALISLLVLPLVVIGTVTYTRVESPQVSVSAMVLLLLLQMGGWLVVGAL